MSEKIIRTVCGDMSPETFGFFHCHEHLWIDGGFIGHDGPVSPIDEFSKSLAEIKLLDKGTAIVDCQPISAGGDASVLKRLSRRSGVGVVASTGFHKLSFYGNNSYILNTNLDQLEKSFLKETAKCGIIKTAVEEKGVTDRYEILHTAAARVSLKTGLKIIVHIDSGADSGAVLDFYKCQGIDEDNIILCHLDRAEPDISVHIEAARRGAFLEYDTIARPKYHTDGRETQIIRKVCDEGFSDKILLGLDTTRERLKSYSGDGAVGLDYLEKTFIGNLRANGFNGETISLFTCRNPRNAISFIKKEEKKQ